MPIDRLQRFPSQIIENRPTECCAETVADIMGNIQDQPLDPGFSYAATLKVMNEQPTTAGSDPYSAMLSAVVYGCLPTENEPFDASTTSELYEANLANFTPNLVHLATLFTAKGVSTEPLYEDICDYLDQERQGVAMAMTWYQSFLIPNADGTLPPPSGPTTNHCVAIYGYDSRGLKIKPWLGSNFGQGGYCYLPEVMFPQVFQGAWSFNLTAWKWGNLAWIAATHWWLWPVISPQLSTSSS